MDAVTADTGVDQEAPIGTAASAAEMWYSRRSAVALTALLLILAQITSFLIPPFQSPDEFNHIKRAYLLSRGEVFLGSEKGVTGGNIDSGLLDYMHLFEGVAFQYANKVTGSTVRASSKIEWSGKEAFSELPNTAAYFPLPYLPQAVALTIGKRTGLTVQESYNLARLFSLLATLGLILVAFLVYPMPLMAFAIFVTPMALFQLGSASLDSVSFGLCTLAGALFMRGADRKFPFSARMHVSLIACLLCLATSRIALFALTPLPALLYATRRSRWYFISSAGLICLSAAWILYALETIEGGPTRALSTAETIKYYLVKPFDFVQVIFATITNGNILTGYWRMFVGVLGWLDTPLGSSVYLGFGILFALLGFLSLARKPSALLKNGGVQLACATSGAILLMYFLFLVTYEAHPAKLIESIQGRYFIPTSILYSYALFNRPLRPYERQIGAIAIAVMIALCIAGAIPRLLARYWMA